MERFELESWVVQVPSLLIVKIGNRSEAPNLGRDNGCTGHVKFPNDSPKQCAPPMLRRGLAVTTAVRGHADGGI